MVIEGHVDGSGLEFRGDVGGKFFHSSDSVFRVEFGDVASESIGCEVVVEHVSDCSTNNGRCLVWCSGLSSSCFMSFGHKCVIR